jgi:hypothetical protein
LIISHKLELFCGQKVHPLKTFLPDVVGGVIYRTVQTRNFIPFRETNISPWGTIMTCHELAECIERLQPEASPREVARLCLLLANHTDNLDALRDEDLLSEAWHKMQIRLHAVTDQYAAMTADLEELSRAKPETLTADQILVLIRAIKVQSQVVQLYLGLPAPQSENEK